MTIRIGINPIGWSNDDMPELGGDTPLETCLREARQAGYEGIELGGKFPRDPALLAGVLERHNLACISGWYGGALVARSVEEERALAAPHLALLRAMGCDIVVFAEVDQTVHTRQRVPLSRRPRMPPDAWPDYGRKLTALADQFAADGLRLAFHHHMGTVVQDEREIDALMAHTGPSVHLLLDTGHATWGGADPVSLAQRYHARIAHVHAKDIRASVRAEADREDWSFLDAVLAGVFTVPGDGSIDYVSVFRALRPYQGWIVVEAEQDPARANPLDYATLGRRNVASFIKQAELGQ
ncbi:myo-inosose-2 dehydratase [Lichenicoccus sp.]|uniref:myo-inosose-2 dehydratase n=1 Tax=Lichenicoccus sp. TaxID=2781899 RepID=UPI003D0F8F78